MKRTFMMVMILWTLPLRAQSSNGELRLTVTDSTGVAVRSTVEIASPANEYSKTFATDDHGKLDAKLLPYGIYQLVIHAPPFAADYENVEIRSAIPLDRTLRLSLNSVPQTVRVNASGMLFDPYRVGSVNEIGQQTIENRLTSLPGRSLQTLINSEPGWLYEGNAVLHPRGSEYQTQFVIDGIPLTDNRSPSFGPEIEANDVESITIYTSGIPAEYGRKMGGVIEVNTLKNADPGLHGQMTLEGASYSTAGANVQTQYEWKENAVVVIASGNRTNHYLNPVVPENYTNRGTTGAFAVNYERNAGEKDRLILTLRHELARYEIPNELVQQNGAYLPDANTSDGCAAFKGADEPSDCVFIPGGQLQTGDNFETLGSVLYQRLFTQDAIGGLRAMSRDNSTDFFSNPASWPLIANQRNDFKEIYFNSDISIHHHAQEFKAGLESDATFLHEDFNYQMPDCEKLSNPQCPITLGILDAGSTSFSFTGSRPDLEQAAYAQDFIRLGKWTVNAGLRWDHYQLLLNENAVSPRLSISHYFPTLALNLHGSYDRVFQTPSFENILLSSSLIAESLDTSVPAVQLPVQPSHGNYYELGLTQDLFDKLRVDANMFRRDVNNFADDSQILSTGISFPIAFRKAVLYGAEGKLEVQSWRGFSGTASYSYIVGNVWNPVTGGLFLGGDASSALTDVTGHSPDSQDQRQTVRARIRYQVARRVWIALGSEYNSGLPFEPDLTPAQYAAEYGQTVIKHIDFVRDRISPYLTEDASLGAEIYRREGFTVKIQGDGANLSNKLQLIDFGGLFSGNAIGPSRSFSVRLTAKF